jgi:hypothetical protein
MTSEVAAEVVERELKYEADGQLTVPDVRSMPGAVRRSDGTTKCRRHQRSEALLRALKRRLLMSSSIFRTLDVVHAGFRADLAVKLNSRLVDGGAGDTTPDDR